MDMQSLVQVVIWIIVIGSVFALLWWMIGYAGLPAPFDKFARIFLAVVAVLIIINFLLGLVGSAPFRLRG